MNDHEDNNNIGYLFEYSTSDPFKGGSGRAYFFRVMPQASLTVDDSATANTGIKNGIYSVSPLIHGTEESILYIDNQ